MLFHLDKKGFYSFCFCYWKLLLKLGRIKFFKNNLPASEIRWNLFFLKNSWQSKIIPACRQTTDFLTGGNHSFSIFQRFLPVIVLFFVQRKSIFQQNPSFGLVETNFLASGNRFLLSRGSSSQWESSMKLVGANFKRKSIFNHSWKLFSSIFSDSSQLQPVKAVFFLQLKYIFQPILHSSQ